MNNGSNGDGSFEARLSAARNRHGLDPKPDSGAAGSNAPPASAMGVGMRVGVELLATLMVGLAIGWGLDRWWHTSPAMLVLFVVLGGAAGVMNVYRLMGPGRMPGGK